jgi:hypothetical protein
MKKSLSFLAALGVGLVCAALLLWLWQENRTGLHRLDAARATPSAPAPVATPTPSAHATAPDPFTRALLASLQRLLARATDARDREALLTFKDADAYRRFLARAKAAGLTILGEMPGLRTLRVRYASLDALRAELTSNSADYAGLSANTLIAIPAGPATPSKEDRAAVTQIPFGNTALAFLGVPAEHSTWGRGVTIAILDTGVMPDATFGNGRLRTLDIGLGTTAGRGEDDGHGTAVAALAAGASADAPGVAPAATLLSIRVTDASGTSDTFTVAQAILAAADAGAKVINVSLGGYATNATLDAAIAYATERGAIIVAAAGNDQAAQLAWPAADARVISVGAVDRAGQQVAFSNSGPTLSLTAPGYGVQTAWLDSQRVTVDGTSASAPLVAGAIAAALSQNSSLTPAAAARLLVQTASDAGSPGADASYGSGILNLDWAMNRNNPTHFDPAIASHTFDAANNQMQFVVQNRSGAAVAGLQLSVNTTAATTTAPPAISVPPLAAGESYIATLPVDAAALTAAGTITYTTQLTTPPGLTDAAPTNNRKSSTLSAPTK